MKVSIIVAATSNTHAIGRKGDLPWKLKEEMQYFRDLTSTTSDENKTNCVIMGRKTYESIPAKFRPLPNRLNIILSKNASIREDLKIPENVLIADSLESALNLLEPTSSTYDQVFIIGGGSVYREAMTSMRCSKIYLTEVNIDIPDADTFFPDIPEDKYQITYRSPMKIEDGISYYFTEYDSIPQPLPHNNPQPLPHNKPQNNPQQLPHNNPQALPHNNPQQPTSITPQHPTAARKKTELNTKIHNQPKTHNQQNNLEITNRI